MRNKDNESIKGRYMGILFKSIDDVEIVRQMFPYYPVNNIQGGRSIRVNHFYELKPVGIDAMMPYNGLVYIENGYGWDVIVYPESMESEKEKIADGVCFHDTIRAIYARMINNALDIVFKQAKEMENQANELTKEHS